MKLVNITIIKNLFLIIMCLFFLSACNEKSSVIDNDTTSPITRAMVDENKPSESNPELLTNWENMEKVLLSSNDNVMLPWVDGTMSEGTETFRKDIKKEDGWRMLFHTFQRVRLDVTQNYMVFYNQLTGVLKVFYYYEGGMKNHGTQWVVKTEKNIKLLDAVGYLARAANEPAITNQGLFSNMTVNPNNGLGKGWSGFEFETAYSQDYANMDVVFCGFDRAVTDFNIYGKESLLSVGTITTKSASSNSSGPTNVIATLGGKSAKQFIDKLAAKSNLGNKIKNAISSISTSGYASAIKAGLGLIFGKTTTTTTQSDVNISTTGTITLSGTGTSESTAGIAPISFNLYRVLNPNGEPPASGHFLGTWRLKQKPKIRYSDFERVTNVSYSGDFIRGKVPYPDIMQCDYEIEFNPDILHYITNVSHSTSYVICDMLQGSPYKNGIYEVHNQAGLLYQDELNTFREFDPMSMYEIEGVVSTELNKRATLFYEWEPIKSGRVIAVVNVTITYNYQGKEITVNQSKSYDVDYINDTELRASNRKRYEQGRTTAIINDYMQ